ncbi:MAG: serine hydrolase [Deltaproteobacteria bacterium]|nr:serine hydrolase [Deltaproteobacteria bacterium]
MMTRWVHFDRLAALVLLGLVGNACAYVRMVIHNAPSLAAPTYFDSREVLPSATPMPLQRAEREATFELGSSLRKKYGSFDAWLEANHTRAFVVVHNDVIIYERYFGEVSSTTLLPSFSMSKTYAAVLIGCALRDGLIASVDQPVTDYIPEPAAKPRYDQVTLDQLLRMTSGIDFDEETSAGGVFYYCTDLRNRMYAYDVKWIPGQHYLYGSVNVQLLWDVLHRRLSGSTVAAYFEKSIWDPIGAEHAASWSLDSKSSGVEKLSAGFNATARDHARLGLLFLHQGTLQGRAVVPKQWIEESLVADPIAGVVRTADGVVRRTRRQWFLTLDGRSYFAKGYHGQYIFVAPDKNVVFVRFGDGYGSVDWTSLFDRLARSL